MADESKWVDVGGRWIDFGNMANDQIEQLLTSKRFTPTPSMEDYGRAAQRGLMEGVGGGSALVGGVPGLVQKGVGAISQAVGGPAFPPGAQMPTPGELMKPVEEDIAKVRAPESTEGRLLEQGISNVADPLNLMFGGGSIPSRAGKAFLGGVSGGLGKEFLGVPEALGTGLSNYAIEKAAKHGVRAEERAFDRAIPKAEDILGEYRSGRRSLEAMNEAYKTKYGEFPYAGLARLGNSLDNELVSSGYSRASHRDIFKQIDRIRTGRANTPFELLDVREQIQGLIATEADTDKQAVMRTAVLDINRFFASQGIGKNPKLDPSFTRVATESRANEAAANLSNAFTGELQRADLQAAGHPPFVGDRLSDITLRRLYSLRYRAGANLNEEEKQLLEAVISGGTMDKLQRLIGKFGPRSLVGRFLNFVTLHGWEYAGDILERVLSQQGTRNRANEFERLVRLKSPAGQAANLPPRPEKLGTLETIRQAPSTAAAVRGLVDALKPTPQDDALQ